MDFEKMCSIMMEMVHEKKLSNERISIRTKVLTPQEAIGDPEHDDYVIQKGRERLMQAEYCGHYGVAFTDMYGDFSGKLNDVIQMKPVNNYRRAIIVSSINAVLSYLKCIDRTIHCKNDGMVLCADKITNWLNDRFHDPKIFQIGFQPRFAERLSENFSVRITDNDRENINKKVNDTFVKDPSFEDEYIDWCDVIFATGSTFVNNTAFKYINSSKPVVFYGVTSAGPAYLLEQIRYCETRE